MNRRQIIRLRLMGMAMAAGIFALGAMLWRMQVRQSGSYAGSIDRQSIRRVRIPARRGRIFDRNGECLADTTHILNVSVYVEELTAPGRRMKTVEKVAHVLDGLREVAGVTNLPTERDIEEHIRLSRPLPLTAIRNAGPETIARLVESRRFLQGIDITVESARVYPRGRLAAHVLGYVGRASPDGAGDINRYHYYLPDFEGKAGLERVYDKLLSGMAGGRLMRVDVAGFQRAEEGYRAPDPGGDLLLALDAGIQESAEAAIEDIDGAVVLLDPVNGDVLAMASSPAFDPNEFTPVLRPEVWRGILENPGKPMLNRACMGKYPPGSTFKPVVALAALQKGAITPGTVFNCAGSYSIGGRDFACYMGHAHGGVSLRRGIEVSCNVFFYQAGLACGADAICAAAAEAGFGRTTGIELPESAGLLPDPAWKKRVLRDAWRDGDTCNLSIGQGALLTTPLQMAVLSAMLANNGVCYRPRLMLGRRLAGRDKYEMFPPARERKASWPAAALHEIRLGMLAVIESGTGRAAHVPGKAMAGKTGTAEYGPRGLGRKRGWMIWFAPFDAPRYAGAMVADEAESGGRTVGPRVGSLMKAVFELEKTGGKGDGAI